MMEQMQPQAKPKRNWLKIALIGSLAVNLLIVGLIVGAMMRFDKGPARHVDRISLGLGVFISALPDDKRQEVRAAGGQQNGNWRSFRKELRQSQRELSKAVMAQPYSEADLRAAIAAHRGRVLGPSEKVQEAFVRVLTDMTEAERAEFYEQAKALSEERRQKRREKKRLRD